jgi:hypothetical protein
MMKKIVIAVVLIALFSNARAQNYQAIHGSPFAGSLGIFNNPAAGVHSHYNWDVTLFSVQEKTSSNAFSSTEPLLNLANTRLYLSNGNKSRYLHHSQDFHILNARLKLDQRRAIAFGLNSRNNIHVKSRAFGFIDTISSFNSFLQYNGPVPSLGGKLVNNTWIELFASYSQIIRNTNTDQLSAGITIKGIRAISGTYLQVDRVRFRQSTQPGSTSTFVVTDPSIKYGYSSNYDRLDDNKSSNANLSDFLKYSQGSIGVDLGVEYLLKDDYAPLYDDLEKLEYNWKIGISLLDLGRNYFKHGIYSRQLSGVRGDVSEEDLQNKFSSPDDIKDFYDSLETIVQDLQHPGTDFRIGQPTRLVINVDKPLQGDFSINGELSINFFSTQTSKSLHTRELNLLTITPRWETAMLGVYIPVQYNTQGQLWIGTAFKAGPLLIGVHDWAWLFSNKRVFYGGGYLALIVRNFFTSSSGRTKRIKNFDCPPF